MQHELIIAKGGYDLALDESATKKQSALLELGGQVLDVTDGATQSFAVTAMQEIKAWLKKVESARKAVKEPVLETGKRIDAIAAKHVAPLEFEFQRLSRLVSAFQEDERKRVAEAEAARQAEIERLARAEAEAALAKEMAEATLSEPEAGEKALNEAVEAEAAAFDATRSMEQVIRAPLPEAQRESGMVVKKVVCWEVTDAAKLYNVFPHFFRLEPNKSVINASVTKDTSLPGLRVWEETKTTVRT